MEDARVVKDYHRGSGTLRGGGVEKIPNKGPSFKNYKNKLDHRLGYCISGALLTIATILVIFGLFHQGVHEELSEYITNLRTELIESLPNTTTAAPTTTEASEVFFASSENETIVVEFTTTAPEITTDVATCIGRVKVDESRCLTPQELQEDWTLLHRSYIALWELFALNIIIFVLLLPLVCVFSNNFVKSKTFKLFYRAALIAALFYLFAQCLYFIKPLLTSAMYYPNLVNKLFVTKEPRHAESLRHLEARYACQFQYSDELVKLNLQQPCIPRLMNSMLPTYAITLLIIIDLIPFTFAVFTYAWDAYIKDTFLCQKARRRIEIHNQNRPQSREDILKKAMAEPRYI